MQIDPFGEIFEDWSPYSFAFDCPSVFNDPWGLAPDDENGDNWEKNKPKPKPKPKYDILPTVTVIGKRKNSNTNKPKVEDDKPNWLGWPPYTKSNVKKWISDQYLYLDRLHAGAPLIQGGESDHYLWALPMYQQWTRAEKDGRSMQMAAVMSVLGPAVAGELGLAAGELELNELYEEAYYYAEQGYNSTVSDFIYAIRYTLGNRLSMDQIIQLERLAQKFRPLNKVLNEKTMKQVLKLIDKIIKQQH